jgi:hypothetical protein
MKRLLFYKILILSVFLAGCQKIDVEPVDGTPVFSATFEVDGISKNWQAGVDGYYMFTEFEKDANDVYVFTGRLQRDSCSAGCGESLTIRIRDFQQVLQGNPDVETALKPGDYFFKNENTDSSAWVFDTIVFYQVGFNASASVSPTGAAVFNWNFGGLGTAAGISPTFDFGTLDQPVPVTLNMAGNNVGCSSLQTRTVQKPTPNSTPCGVQIFVQNDSTGPGTMMTAMAEGNGPYTYMWSNGSLGQSISLPFNQQPQASVTVTDATGCSSTSSLSFFANPGTVPQYCAAAFSYDVVEVIEVDSALVFIPGDSLQFSKVTIEYSDATGKLYRSGEQAQAGFSFFKILSTEDYDTNENGEKTKKLNVRFACRLWDEQGNFIEIKNGEAVVAVAYPQ